MDQTPRRRTLREKAALLFSLPVDAVAGVPLVELRGDGQLRVENHRGILAYAPTEIHISGGKMALRVRGAGLELRVMNARELLITGHILSVELE